MWCGIHKRPPRLAVLGCLDCRRMQRIDYYIYMRCPIKSTSCSLSHHYTSSSKDQPSIHFIPVPFPQSFIIMHTPLVLPAMMILVLSSFSIALPQNSNSQFHPEHDGAPAGCHAVDFIKACLDGHLLAGASEETDQEQADRVAASCGDFCWPAVYGKPADKWDPSSCAVSCFSSP